eukprot:CAMPEP_0198737088 /NCGR_PEP_ID=MMETSP1475-20131203/67668_1 /TAXON_ID= ORGANISM="Unidentified sp., Strain CCMP1999" /NCGR_SAMPLE_ID=MMETSP1475 /ASSEMBLY_ACC=CAM_ASM_001111 /LENGTH=219 /DNA_ID=CAMNT_0044500945 /DNA_START=748 /DNA_END=1405 /DNA_ORIENTATION=-
MIVALFRLARALHRRAPTRPFRPRIVLNSIVLTHLHALGRYNPPVDPEPPPHVPVHHPPTAVSKQHGKNDPQVEAHHNQHLGVVQEQQHPRRGAAERAPRGAALLLRARPERAQPALHQPVEKGEGEHCDERADEACGGRDDWLEKYEEVSRLREKKHPHIMACTTVDTLIVWHRLTFVVWHRLTFVVWHVLMKNPRQSIILSVTMRTSLQSPLARTPH